MYFLSSPPPQAQASPFCHSTTKQKQPSLSWTKPQTHENSYRQAQNRSYYPPHSPSPLRTARNANLMQSPTRHSGSKDLGIGLLSSSPLRAGADEEFSANENKENGRLNAVSASNNNIFATPTGRKKRMDVTGGCFDGDGPGEGSSLITPPDSGSAPSPFVSAFSPDQSSASAAASRRPATSQWELRSRSSSPSSLLASQTHRNREERKHRFLDRIRRRRDDDRSDAVGDQVLRMDFVKERRGWEEQMARRAAIESFVDLDEEEEEDIDVEEVGVEEMSPTEEYDDLIREFEYDGRGQVRQEDDFIVDDADDEEYERLFREMEILSQQSPSQSQSQLQGQKTPHQQRENALDTVGDEVMDLS